MRRNPGPEYSVCMRAARGMPARRVDYLREELCAARRVM
ncbi:MAG TPA: hypothetical protein DEV75_13260 [Desulfovibrio sp.]|nr:hypothetical protein [Desulfovibrio sp.]